MQVFARIAAVVLVVALFAVCTSGCNTVEGAGQDIEDAGEGIEDAAD